MLLEAVAVVPHTDADGLAAGAIALRARGEGAVAAILLGRGLTPFDDDAPLPAGPLAILDWGIRPLDRPALLVDHHAADGSVLLDRRYPTAIQDALVVWDPEAPTAALMRRVVPEAPAWLAAVGAVGDAGDAGFALPECGGAPKTAVRKLVPLVNAPRRLPDGPVRTALALLVEHDDPRAALADPRIAELQEAKAAWRAEFDRVVRTAPRVGDRVAVLRFTSPAQVHPLVAQTWSRRLKPRVVLAANDDYLPGRVNFAVRGGRDGEDLRALLRDAGLDPVHGHARATGGSLEPPAFERLQEALLSA
jgi:single-stranded-DNA-specific exonuclease